MIRILSTLLFLISFSCTQLTAEEVYPYSNYYHCEGEHCVYLAEYGLPDGGIVVLATGDTHQIRGLQDVLDEDWNELSVDKRPSGHRVIDGEKYAIYKHNGRTKLVRFNGKVFFNPETGEQWIEL